MNVSVSLVKKPFYHHEAINDVVVRVRLFVQTPETSNHSNNAKQAREQSEMNLFFVWLRLLLFRRRRRFVQKKKRGKMISNQRKWEAHYFL